MNRSNTKLTHIQQIKGQYKIFIQQALLKKIRDRKWFYRDLTMSINAKTLFKITAYILIIITLWTRSEQDWAKDNIV